MKILFIVPYYKPAYIYGGPIVVIPLLAETLVRMGHSVTVFTSTANGAQQLAVTAGEKMLVDGVQVIYFPRVTGDNTHASPALWKHLGDVINDFDVVHLHSWWNALIVGAAWVCLRHQVVPLISPHGMFSDYILTTNNALKKNVLQRLIGKRLLRNSYLHVSTNMEWEESQKIIPNWSGRIIPNLVILPTKKNAVKKYANDNVLTIGFLSRIDPKKGLDILIKALSKVDFNYRLKIGGDGEPEYVQSLKKLALELGNADHIEWVGWQKGEDKFDFLAELDLFALLSHSENFAIVVIEALASGVPVVVSNQVGLHSYVERNDYGWVTNLSLEDIRYKLNLCNSDIAKRIRIAANAPDTIRAEYEDFVLAQQYVELYESIACK